MTVSKARLGTIMAILFAAVLSIAIVLTGVAMTKGDVFTRDTSVDDTCVMSEDNVVQVLSNICGSRHKLTVRYGDSNVECDTVRTVEDTKKAPTVLFTDAIEGAKYTILLVDPDAPGSSVSKLTFYLHWLITDIKGSDLRGSGLKGKEIMKYFGPSPPAGSGKHRYQFLLFETTKQGDTTLHEINQRAGFSLKQFVQDNSMCTLIDTFEFKVEVTK